MAEDKKPEFAPQEKRLKLDAHKVLIKTGFSEVEERYFIEVKSLNSPLFKGRQYITDPDDADIIFRNLKKKDDVYNYIEGIYKEPKAMSLSKIFADEKAIRDENKAKEMADTMAAQDPAGLPAADVEEPAPVDDETPEENKDGVSIPLEAPGLFARTVKFDTIFSETIDKIKHK